MEVAARLGERGQPRNVRDAAFLASFDLHMRVPIIVSAVLPLIVVPDAGNWLGVAVGVGSWLVFLVDYVVHQRRVRGFLSTGFGRFDLVIVVLTAPWFLLPGAHTGSFVVLLRLARLVRLIVASRGAHRLMVRLGRVVAVAAGVLVTASLVAYVAERHVNPEFSSVGTALWWGIVTLTTVGYGDVVPITTTGRLCGVVIMITGIGVLGVLAGSLASFFRLEPGDEAAPAPRGSAADTSAPRPVSDHQPGGDVATQLSALTTEVAELRAELRSLRTHLAGAPPDPAARGER